MIEEAKTRITITDLSVMLQVATTAAAVPVVRVLLSRRFAFLVRSSFLISLCSTVFIHCLAFAMIYVIFSYARLIHISLNYFGFGFGLQAGKSGFRLFRGRGDFDFYFAPIVLGAFELV